MNNYTQQVKREHYSFRKYYSRARWISFWNQTNEILKLEDIKSVLDVGPGSDLLKNILLTFSKSLSYKTLDLAEDLEPDFVGEITNIPLSDNSYDAVCAFQVLEHIKFEDFEKSLIELKRVSKKYVLISLPHYGPFIQFQLKLPLLPLFKCLLKLPYPKKHVFDGQHYWEIGKKGYSINNIRKILEKHFSILDEYTSFENHYHRFYILKV